MQNFPKLVILSHAGILVQIPTIAWYFFLSYHSLDISYAFKGEVQSSISHLNKNLTFNTEVNIIVHKSVKLY